MPDLSTGRTTCKWEDGFSAVEMDCPDHSSDFLTKIYVSNKVTGIR